MRVAVIGAGIVGVTTAWELVADGHEVTVYERCGSVAAEGSFANAGIVAPGYGGAWGPLVSAHGAATQLFGANGSARLAPRLDVAAWRWLWRQRRARRAHGHAARALQLQRLAHYSRERLRSLTGELGLSYERADGCLVLLRHARDLAEAQPLLQALADSGTRHEVVDPLQCRRIEPGLNPDAPLHAGIHLPDGESGNCRQFAHLLRVQAQQRGAQFRFHSRVASLGAGAPPSLVHVHAPPEESTVVTPAEGSPGDGPLTQPLPFEPITEHHDAIVVCAALDARALLRPLGVRVPLAPVYGHSVTAPLRHYESHPDIGPRSAVIDERLRVAVSRIGQRVRVAGGAQLGGDASARELLAVERRFQVGADRLPRVAHSGPAQRGKGARPMLPDGLPVVGASGAPGVWLNLGHGASGWTLACGSARLLADVLAGRAPAFDGAAALGIERLR